MLEARISVRQAGSIEERFVLDKVRQWIFPRSTYMIFESNGYLLSVSSSYSFKPYVGSYFLLV